MTAKKNTEYSLLPEEEYLKIFDGDPVAAEIRSQQVRQEIDSMLDETFVKSMRATGRTNERARVGAKDATSPLVKVNKNGLVTREDGRTSHSEMLSLLDPNMDDDEEIEITQYAMNKIKRQMRAAVIGPITTVSMVCAGSKCQIKETCPYYQNNAAPIGEECIVEKHLIREWVERYIEEFQVDINKTTEVQLVSELAEIAVFERRINSYISIHNPMMMQENVAGIDNMGNPYYNIDIAKAFEIKSRLKQQRMKILDAMLATRDRKAKLVVAAANANGNLNELSNLKRRIDEIVKNKKGTIIDVNAEHIQEL